MLLDGVTVVVMLAAANCADAVTAAAVVGDDKGEDADETGSSVGVCNNGKYKDDRNDDDDSRDVDGGRKE